MTHRWDTEPVRPDAQTTYRSCCKCGLVRITRHEADNRPRHWVEWEKDGRKIYGAGTPACEPAHVR